MINLISVIIESYESTDHNISQSCIFGVAYVGAVQLSGICFDPTLGFCPRPENMSGRATTTWKITLNDYEPNFRGA